ncbi:PREDICTED: histone-lysine N-methyltransferase SETMAR-like [Acromyrmex echinatior]|uniref:histone-lysine N-methyltransferase SETMAR-like n=1 Tax=Acromyrmex echinatior TaxID=103372 RepID=UPI00058105BE|nr:PREDICTED: histone-lysine N-methyltransferase SETMAR-like [Acromyrmex echinatior]
MGRTSTEDAPRSGRPKEATNAEIVQQVHQIVLSDRKVKLRELTEAVGISKERVGYILRDVLEMKKLLTQWVPRLLTIDQKQQRVDDSTAGLALLQRNRADFFRRFVTMNETWKGRTVTGEYYAALLDKLNDEIKKKRPHMAKKKVLYHHASAPLNTSLKAMVKLNQLRFELVAHPPYSPDLTPSDYYLFPKFKRWFRGKRFTSNEEVIAETEAYFEGLDVSYYRKGIEMLENRYTKCIALEGNYVEE